MKRLLLLISFAILFLHAFTQTNVQRDYRVSPILKQALASKSGYYIYGRAGTARFINIAVLNQSTHTLYWFTCHGRLFDSTKLTNQEIEQVTSKQLDPFVLYQNICDKYLANISTVKDIYRVYGDNELFDRLNPNYRALFAMESIRTAKTPLQKLMVLENVRKGILAQLAYMNCVNPFGLTDNPLYKTNKEQAGSIIQTKDSTLYYNVDPTSAIRRISLHKKYPEKLFVYNRLSELIDSMPVLPEKYNLLLKEKTDVFLLYRGWLELQWQQAMSNVRRPARADISDGRLYSQANINNEKEIEKVLYNQLNAINTKINLLISPEAKNIEQAVYETYKNEASEISYIPLLGIGYSLTQTRGQKEYELTNHLGNVLVTVTDKKIGVSSASDSSLIDHYEPDIVSAHDYYPFGMLQPGRSYLSPNADKYRYGFNGKENDNEVKGKGNQLNFGSRIYDPRIGRFLSVDPLQKKTPDLSCYNFAADNPISNIDKDGMYALFIHYMLTRYMLMQAGVSEVQANLIAHYASTFADNPASIKSFNEFKSYSIGDLILMQNLKEAQKDNPIFKEIGGKLTEKQAINIVYMPGIDYSRTVKSQSEDPEAQKWHATRTYAESNAVTSKDAINRSLVNAWDMLFKSANQGGIDKMTANSTAIENLGQALHTFQDMEAHQGAVFRATLLNGKGYFSTRGNEHNLTNDSKPDPNYFGIAKTFTGNAIFIHQIMSGNYKNVIVGANIITYGMSEDHLKALKEKMNKGGFTLTQDKENSNVYTIGKKE
ncbi:RHS repeat domain-containing protein [Longitalea luteola]|uniref:RHS repeat domain-containing protein n=1 Tax=Longitalea luteola TaxID=2812563 RepID=UPI001A97C01D|nr:RHS repeat-associated core domain-containing protein [Longitalea luteola]